jgi:LPXTG-motif cell wall-anchored protein
VIDSARFPAMATLRSLGKPAAIAGVVALSGLAAAPALAYPPGVALTISCDATTVAAGASFTCTLTNTNPAGPDDIALGGLVAGGDGVSFALASVAAQDSGTYSETLTAPTTPGTYEVIGTSADETATTEIHVTGTTTGGGGQPTTPDTGANVTLGLVAGLGALGLGGGLYAASRRKKV